MTANKYPRDKRHYPTRDWLSQSGAEALAGQIRVYWAASGQAVETHIVAVAGDREALYVVRSDMVGGMPVAREAETERAA